MDSAPLSISDLADVLKGHLNGMGTLEVTGEISGYKTYPSGHHYFSLKDSEAKVDCVLYSFQARWLKTPLRDGLKVIAKAKADFYRRPGSSRSSSTASSRPAKATSSRSSRNCRPN